MRKKVGRLSRRNRSLAQARPDSNKKCPHSFVITRGPVGDELRKLTLDYRQVMEPNTASSLKGTKRNKVKDFVSIAGNLNVTHLIMFTQTSKGFYIKLCRLPHGPTVVFRILTYSRMCDVLSSLKRPLMHEKMYKVGPCLMTNLQPQDGDLHLQLCARMFLDMFPTITPNEAKTEVIRRCCLINYDPDADIFDFRHYAIRVARIGVSKAVKKLSKRSLPDLSKWNDVSDFMMKSEVLSESEAEDDPSSHVNVSAKFSAKLAKKKTGPQKSAVRLSEIGPRLTLKLIKIEEGLMEGATLYSNIFSKTDEEKLELENKIRTKKQLKIQRREEQEKHVEAKKQRLEKHKQKCLEGMGLAQAADQNNIEEDDDVEYYRQEVGEEPDADLLQKKPPSNKRRFQDKNLGRKKVKVDKGGKYSEKSSPFNKKDRKDTSKASVGTRKERKQKKILASKHKPNKGKPKGKRKR